jgi:hypothetical protein
MLNRVLQSLAVVVSVLLVIIFDLVSVFQSQVSPVYQTYFDPKTVFSVVSGITYLVLIIAFFLVSSIPPIRRKLDSNYIYTGHYISRPEDDKNEANVFTIDVSLVSFRYVLNGDSFNFQTGECVGSWRSEYIHFGANDVVKYAYTGRHNMKGTPFAGEGYAHFHLFGENHDRGFGYWVDDSAHDFRRRESKYEKVTGDLQEQLLREVSPFRRFLTRIYWSRRSIFAYYKARFPQT